MAVLKGLKPERVFSFFEQLCAIPHGSGNTKAISDWLAAFAKERGLVHHQDAWNNIVIIKEATPGYENAPTVILQGHIDMVCEQSPDCKKDMARDGLDLAVEGDTIFALGTTLGADNGIAVAIAMAILETEGLSHPRLEAVFTADEETGMYGAAGLDGNLLQGRMMINMDSGHEGIFTAGCAGGNISCCKVPVTRTPYDGIPLHIAVDGLRGGHSGSKINKGRGNANMLLGRVLCEMAKCTELRIISVNGGLKDNAIPVRAAAAVLVKDAAAAKQACVSMEQILCYEYRTTEPDLTVRVTEGTAGDAMDAASTEKVVCLLTCAPNGVQAMSADMPGLVQTSLNLGILETEECAVNASFCVRSSVKSQKQMIVDRLDVLSRQLGGCVETAGDYPGWEFRKESPLRDCMIDVFTKQYGYPPEVKAIHAGLECGLFADKLPGLDCVAIGPEMTGLHTVQESLSIASVERTWTFLTEVLKQIR